MSAAARGDLSLLPFRAPADGRQEQNTSKKKREPEKEDEKGERNWKCSGGRDCMNE